MILYYKFNVIINRLIANNYFFLPVEIYKSNTFNYDLNVLLSFPMSLLDSINFSSKNEIIFMQPINCMGKY